MATPDDEVFGFLALCTQRPGQPHVVEPLLHALATLPAGIDLVAVSERHGLAGLVLQHIREAKAVVAPDLTVRLFARYQWHARAAALRRRVAGDAIAALTNADIPLLVLKGAALAQMVYADAVCRPMRDVDMLVRPHDARRADDVLRQIGFAPTETPTAIDHHHLPGLFKSEGDTTILIELHHQLLPPTLFATPVIYDDLISSAQTFDWHGLTLQTLGPEDMVWHVYMHGFAINPASPEIRLGALADLVHTVEAWSDRLDWAAVRRRRGGMSRALRSLDRLVPWSHGVARNLGIDGSRTRGDVASLDEWAFRLRYGIDSPLRGLWYRRAGHPLRVALERSGFALRRFTRQWHQRP